MIEILYLKKPTANRGKNLLKCQLEPTPTPSSLHVSFQLLPINVNLSLITDPHRLFFPVPFFARPQFHPVVSRYYQKFHSKIYPQKCSKLMLTFFLQRLSGSSFHTLNIQAKLLSFVRSIFISKPFPMFPKDLLIFRQVSQKLLFISTFFRLPQVFLKFSGSFPTWLPFELG